MKKLLVNPHFFAIITIFCWAPTYVMTRLIQSDISAGTLGFTRYFVASCLLLILIFAKNIKPPDWKDTPWFIAAGASGFSIYMLIFNYGASLVSAATSSIIIACAPVITALLARVFFREKLNLRKWAAICIEFIGIIVLVMTGSSVTINIGVLWLLLAALLLSVYNILQRKLSRKYSPLQTSIYSIFAGTIMLSIFTPTAIKELPRLTRTNLIYLLILCVFSSAVAYVTWTEALGRAEKTSTVTNYMFITPFLAALLGFILAKETLAAQTILGGIIILTGAFLFNFRPAHKI